MDSEPDDISELRGLPDGSLTQEEVDRLLDIVDDLGADVAMYRGKRDAALAYIDLAIQQWRASDRDYARYYVDAFQSVRVSLFGDLLD